MYTLLHFKIYFSCACFGSIYTKIYFSLLLVSVLYRDANNIYKKSIKVEKEFLVVIIAYGQLVYGGPPVVP